MAGNLAGAAAAAGIGGLCYLGILCPEAKPIPLPAEPPAPQPKPNDCEPGSVGADDEGDGNEPRPPKPDRVPPDWITKPTKKNDGTEYINPENDNDRIRVMQGNPNSPYPEQQVPYVRDQKGGFRDVNGNPIRGPDPGRTPDAHIPYDQFRFRR